MHDDRLRLLGATSIEAGRASPTPGLRAVAVEGIEPGGARLLYVALEPPRRPRYTLLGRAAGGEIEALRAIVAGFRLRPRD